MAHGQGGQSTVEWSGLVLLAALALVMLARVTGPLDPRGVGDALVEAIVCAVGGQCGADLEDVYGRELARALREHAPNIVYERGSAQLPVDFRRCRAVTCANGSDRPVAIGKSDLGMQVTAFTRIVDRRSAGGPLYLQYWLYFPESFTAGVGRKLGPLADRWPGFHPDDWEGIQYRVSGSGRVLSRATAHGGYSSEWAPWPGWYRVSGGSHAGQLVSEPGNERRTPSSRIMLVPLEGLTGLDRHEFEVSPPWAKAVYKDPESADS